MNRRDEELVAQLDLADTGLAFTLLGRMMDELQAAVSEGRLGGPVVNPYDPQERLDHVADATRAIGSLFAARAALDFLVVTPRRPAPTA